MTCNRDLRHPIAQPIIAVPLQSLQAEGGVTHTWLFDPATQTVRRQRVQVVNVAGNEIVHRRRTEVRRHRCHRWVHQLKEGQRVRLLSEATQLAPTAPATLKPDTRRRAEAVSLARASTLSAWAIDHAPLCAI